MDPISNNPREKIISRNKIINNNLQKLLDIKTNAYIINYTDKTRVDRKGIELQHQAEERNFKLPELSKKIKGETPQEIAAMIRAEQEKHIKKKHLEKKDKLSDADMKFWSESISEIANKYQIPGALLVSIISRESNGSFKRHINAATGSGPMQLTTIACKDFMPVRAGGGGWADIYEMMDPELYNDVVYKDGDRNKGLRATSPKNMRDICYKDDFVGIKTGLLSFEMNYIKAVAKKHFKVKTPNINHVKKTIQGIKNGTIKLTENENKQCVTDALRSYNSVFQSYAPEVVDSLSTHGVSFKDLYFIK